MRRLACDDRYDGEVVNATNMTAAWAEFEKTLPKMTYIPTQTLAGALLRPRTNELYWSTSDGHMLMARLKTTYVDENPAGAAAVADGTSEGGGGDDDSAVDLGGVQLARIGLENLKLLMVGNESGTEPSPWKVGFASNYDLKAMLYHDAHGRPSTA